MKRKVLICSRPDTDSAKKTNDKLVEWLKKNGHDVVDVSRSDKKISAADTAGVEVGVVIGGDGTFLTLVRRLEQKDQFPILGINLGTLGFITEVSADDMISAVDSVLAGKCKEEGRPLLQVDLFRDGKEIESGMVFNDVVVTKDPKTTMLKFDLSVGNEFVSYIRADGYVVSTPTGSTGYALSAGGPLIHPEVRAMLLVPLSSHSLSARPLIVPENRPVEIFLKEARGTAYLVFDGQVDVELRPQDRIRIVTSKTQLRVVKYHPQKWFQTLRSKLQMS